MAAMVKRKASAFGLCHERSRLAKDKVSSKSEETRVKKNCPKKVRKASAFYFAVATWSSLLLQCLGTFGPKMKSQFYCF